MKYSPIITKKYLVPFLLFCSSTALAAERVISLSPALTEMVFALGEEKRLVGAVEFSDYPEAAKKIPRVGSYNVPDVEKIVKLTPDLILLQKEGDSEIAYRLQQLNLPFQVFEITKLSQVGKTVFELGKLLDNKKAGRAFQKNWNKKLKKFSRKKRKKIASLIIIQTTPLMAVGNHTFLNEMITRCGGKNVYANLKGYPRIQEESLFTKKPKKVFVVEHFDNDKAKRAAQKRWAKLKAPVYFIPPDLATRAGPRLLKGLEMICAHMKE